MEFSQLGTADRPVSLPGICGCIRIFLCHGEPKRAETDQFEHCGGAVTQHGKGVYDRRGGIRQCSAYAVDRTMRLVEKVGPKDSYITGGHGWGKHGPSQDAMDRYEYGCSLLDSCPM